MFRLRNNHDDNVYGDAEILGAAFTAQKPLPSAFPRSIIAKLLPCGEIAQTECII